MTGSLPTGLEDCLLWSPERGMGFHTRPPMAYTESYWAEYLARDASPMGEALTRARVDFVRACYTGPVIDIGIGGGGFVRALGAGGFGFDVNPEANDWLRYRLSYLDPYRHDNVLAITCWDSLEHIPDPGALVARAREWVFVSMPIYGDLDDLLASKHYKPGEHLWYWTDAGLVSWFEGHGFELVADDDFETRLGREGIGSYAFRRVASR